MAMSVSEKVNQLFDRSYKAAKARFGIAWKNVPKELRVLYVQSAVLGAIAGIDIDEIQSVDGRARIAEYCTQLAHMASQLEDA